MSTPYTGISDPGADLFFVDGDFTSIDPCGIPELSFPLKGDSIFSNLAVVYFIPDGSGGGDYETVPLGSYPNLQPWSPNQVAAVLEQEFMCAQSAYESLSLNTPYNPSWANGWNGAFIGQPYSVPPLDQFYLVDISPLEDVGAGISRFKMKFATLPQTRNEVEQFSYQFVGYDDEATGTTRAPFTKTVLSRLQYDYFIFDDLDILSLPLFVAPADGGDGTGRRLDASNGLYGATALNPYGLILQAQNYYAGSDDASIQQNLFTESLSDGDGSDPTTVTQPSFTNYQLFIANSGAELVVESSTMTRYLGNIWVRRTRFLIAQ